MTTDIRTITKSQVNECFSGESQQHNVLVNLYRLLYRQAWDEIDSLEGWPKSGAELHQWIGERFIRFDRAHHREVLAGGLWLNNGFSCGPGLGPWEVRLAPYTLKGGPR